MNTTPDQTVEDAEARVARGIAAIAAQGKIVAALKLQDAPTEAALALMADLEDALEAHVVCLEALLGIVARPAPVQ